MSRGPFVLGESLLDVGLLASDDDAARHDELRGILTPPEVTSDRRRSNDTRDAMHIGTAIRYGAQGSSRGTRTCSVGVHSGGCPQLRPQAQSTVGTPQRRLSAVLRALNRHDPGGSNESCGVSTFEVVRAVRQFWR